MIDGSAPFGDAFLGELIIPIVMLMVVGIIIGLGVACVFFA